MNESNKNRIDILGVGVDKLSYEKVIVDSLSAINFGKKLFIITANAEGLMLAQKDKEFKRVILEAELVTADGMGPIWAARFLNYKTPKNIFKFLIIPFQAFFSLFAIIFYPRHLKKILPERVSGADLFWEIIHKVYEMDKSVFLLGGEEGVAYKVKEKLERKFSGIKIVGAYAGYPEERGLVERINKTDSDILFVAWGQPKQEKWIAKNLNNLNAKVFIGIGGTFDFVVGKVKRAPENFQKLGFEWLWRLIQEPKRIGRVFIAVPKFIFKTIAYKIRIS